MYVTQLETDLIDWKNNKDFMQKHELNKNAG